MIFWEVNDELFLMLQFLRVKPVCNVCLYIVLALLHRNLNHVKDLGNISKSI